MTKKTEENSEAEVKKTTPKTTIRKKSEATTKRTTTKAEPEVKVAETKTTRKKKVAEVETESVPLKKPTSATAKKNTATKKSTTKKTTAKTTKKTPSKTTKEVVEGEEMIDLQEVKKKRTAKKQEKTENKNIENIKEIEETKKKPKQAKKTTVKKDQKKINKAEDTKKSKKRDQKVSSIIKEQISNINNINKIDEIEKEEEELTKNEIKQIEKQKKESQKIDEAKIEAQIEEAKKMPKDRKLQINKKVFVNIMWAIFATVYLILINLGELNVEKSMFETDLRVFSLGMLAATIIIFEKAYNRDSGTIAIFGIETLVMGIITLLSIYVYILHQNIFINVIGTISAIAISYYIIKCVIIVIKEKRKWNNSISDVKKIISES